MKIGIPRKTFVCFIITLIALLVIPLLLTACGPTAPTNEEAKQAILEYIKDYPFPDYQGAHDVLVYQIGKPVTIGNPPNEFPAWPVKATIYRYNRPAIDDKIFIIAKDSFGEWWAPPLLQ